MSCGVGRRCGSDPTLLRMRHRPVATALIQPLAWEFPCATSVALREKKKKKEALSQAFRPLWKHLLSFSLPASPGPLQPCSSVLALSSCPPGHLLSVKLQLKHLLSPLSPTSGTVLAPYAVPPCYQPSACRENEGSASSFCHNSWCILGTQ